MTEIPPGWIPVFVPAAIAADVLRSVAAFVESGAPPSTALAGPSEWADATSEDMGVFFRDVSSLEWRLVVELAGHERPVPVADLAAALGVEVGAVAGAIGPINKRAKREGWTAPIRPSRYHAEPAGNSKRGLMLADELRSWALARQGEPVTRGATSREP